MFSDRRLLVLICSVTLGACQGLPTGTGDRSNRQAFLDGLAAEPAACSEYRELYVQGFRANVASISDEDPALKSESRELLQQSARALAIAGVPQESCSRPYCIIEPLQGGRLDSWCGFRIPADQGDELYQWLDWSDMRK
jgi:hypothetical protein